MLRLHSLSLILTMKEYLEYTKAAIVSQLSNLKRITKAVFTNLGDCKPIRQFYIQCLEAFCDGTLLCMNGIWFSVWLVCGMFTTQIAVGLKLSKYLMRMDDYMYEGIEVEESVESPPDDKSSGFSVSYAPSGMKAPTGQYRWRKFEENPYHMPKELEGSATACDSNDSALDIRRWAVDRTKPFVIDSIADEVKKAKETRAKGQHHHPAPGDAS
ncbi:uncharacterized protein LOC142769101 isoform X1 [Rhipicephalus microplus]|uniref:uncharacterized protein LOC142769101 isoform X1 n=1 Tax=Rhipicephalus microplus TaxID=6941 RepID=UPI003F6C2315